MHPAGMLEPEETTCTARTNPDYTWREITTYSESQELIITLRIVLEPEETTCTARTNSNYAWREIMDYALS